MSSGSQATPHEWVRRWEQLPAGAQLAITLPIAIGVLFAIHILLLNQPLWRGLGYGVFWGVLVTAAILVATRTERAKRGGSGRAP